MDKIKKIKPMLCPICGEMYFSGLHKNDDERKIQEYLNGEVQCSHCGWVYELGQLDEPDTYIGFNEKTLNEYKRWYEEKIKENPNYDYLEDNLPDPVPYICPICGKHEFETYGYCEICPMCGWEDDEFQEEEPDDPRGANGMSLNNYKKQYEKKIQHNPQYVWKNECK